MTIRLTDKANEESTAILRVSFTDSDGNAVIPKSATWTLSDRDNEVVNGRDEVQISPLASAVNIVLKGDDLKLPFPRERVRRVLVKAIYDSSTYGDDLPFNEEFEFTITDLRSLNAP
ncbi:MAG: hypothetical protein ABTS22_15410 [Accumulibacter sp.]|uniref:hypothetical protein n=1 Tax=Accumulibacter sp. TaxID=2053492 RepID=UPI0033147B72